MPMPRFTSARETSRRCGLFPSSPDMLLQATSKVVFQNIFYCTFHGVPLALHTVGVTEGWAISSCTSAQSTSKLETPFQSTQTHEAQHTVGEYDWHPHQQLFMPIIPLWHRREKNVSFSFFPSQIPMSALSFQSPKALCFRKDQLWNSSLYFPVSMVQDLSMYFWAMGTSFSANGLYLLPILVHWVAFSKKKNLFVSSLCILGT